MSKNLSNLQSPRELEGFFRANKRYIADQEWLARAIEPQCRYKKGSGGGILQSQQNPWELAPWLILAASIKPTSYLEIGCFECGTFYITDSYLRVASPGYGRALAVDKDTAPATFAEYAKDRDVTFISALSRRLRLDQPFDIVLIDALHGKESVLNDFRKVENLGRLIGFHDIAWKRTRERTGAAFNEIVAVRPKCKTWKFVDRHAERTGYGIGALLLK